MKKYKIKYLENSEVKYLILKEEELDSSSLPSNILDISEKKDFLFFYKSPLSNKDLLILLYEINLMLEANLNYSDVLNILIKNKNDKRVLELLEVLKNSFLSNKDISSELKRLKLDNMVCSFFQVIENGGDVKLNIKSLYLLLKEMQEIKKKFYKAISYPIFLLFTFFLSLVSMFYFVIPKFKSFFSNFDDKLPMATKVLFSIEEFFTNHFLFIVIFLSLFIFGFFYLFYNNENIKLKIEEFIFLKVPVVKDLYLSLQMYKLFLVLEIMLNSNYEFLKALNSSKVLIHNKTLLDKISHIENLLQNGKSIHYSFSQVGIFDELVLNLINSAEISNLVPKVCIEIKKIYKNRFDEKMALFISIIQPLFIFIIMALILWVIMAILMPMWDMGNMLKF